MRYAAFITFAVITGFFLFLLALGAFLTFDPPWISTEDADMLRSFGVRGVIIAGLITVVLFKKDWFR